MTGSPDLPVIPETITVHLGLPDSAAENVTVSFTDYIKNVASSEIYPTWPENALRANIYAQISYALNRIYTEYYPSRGYDFDITSTTAYDQAFVNGRDVFENISLLVDELFDSYVQRQGSVEPLFTQYCDGKEVFCSGLQQWDTVELARQGMTPYQILQHFYGDDINIISNVPVQSLSPSYPEVPLKLGSAGNDVLTVQTRLNRISTNFPNIPKIYPADATFGKSTEDAVKEFQRTFNLTADGIVGKATWYEIAKIYAAVKRLSELNSEGVSLEDVSKQYPNELKEGDTGLGVKVVQYFLNYASQFDDGLYALDVDGIFGPLTKQAVIDFQSLYGLPETGVVDKATYNKLYRVYRGDIESLDTGLFTDEAAPYPGYALLPGSSGDYVTLLQTYLNYISDTLTDIPKLTVDGVYGSATEEAVRIYQELMGIEVSGITGINTWNSVATLYDDLKAGEHIAEDQYPGTPLGEE